MAKYQTNITEDSEIIEFDRLGFGFSKGLYPEESSEPLTPVEALAMVRKAARQEQNLKASVDDISRKVSLFYDLGPLCL